MFEEVTHSPLGPSQVQNPSSPISCWSFYIAVTKRLDTMSIRVGKFLPCMHGNYRGNYPVFTDTVEILSTMVEMVEMVEILKVITDTVKILSTMVEMVEILKVVITDTVKILSTIVARNGRNTKSSIASRNSLRLSLTQWAVGNDHPIHGLFNSIRK